MTERGTRFADDRLMVARVQHARARYALLVGDLWTQVREFPAAARAYREIANRCFACVTDIDHAFACLLIGQHEAAEAMLREVLATAKDMRMPRIAAGAIHNLGHVIAEIGRFAEAEEVEREAIAAAMAAGDLRNAGSSQNYLALILLRTGRAADAVAAAQEAERLVTDRSGLRCMALVILSRALLADGQPDRALETVREARELLEAPVAVEEGEVQIWLAWAEALATAGRRAEALASLAEARQRMFAQADRIPDVAVRASFLERIPEHARVLALSREWS